MKAVYEHRDAERLHASRGPGSTDGPVWAWRGKIALLSLVVWTFATLGGCGGSGGTAAQEGTVRTGVEWQLESFQQDGGGPSPPVPNPALYTVRFNADGSLAARADCNRCAGGYQLTGARMTIDPLACTLAACPLPSLGEQFTAALTRVSSYVQTPSELVLAHDGGALRFRAAQ